MRNTYPTFFLKWFPIGLFSVLAALATAQSPGKIVRATPRDTLWMTEDSIIYFKMIVCSLHEGKAGPTFKLERKDMKVGNTIVLPSLPFDPNKAEIKDEMLVRLRELASFLKANPDLSIEIGAHTNSNPSPAYADELTERRAKAIADWLVAQGIPPERAQHSGYGKKCPIADNRTIEGRKQNVRVEITILKMNP